MAEKISNTIRKKRKKLSNIRNAEKKHLVNAMRKSRIKTYISKLEHAIAKKLKKEEIIRAFSEMQSEIMKGVSKKTIQKKTASRKISRMFNKVKAAITD